MWPACSDDTLQELMDRESGYMHLETVTSDKSTNVYFKISDSGQTTEYLFGDDGSYINIPNEINFTAHDNISGSDDVVVDNVSGLMWTKCTLNAGGGLSTQDDCGDVAATTPKVYQSTALTNCENLTYAGYSDWRLPSAPELFTLIHFGEGTPAIDSTVFPGSPPPFLYNGNNILFYWTKDTGTVFGEISKWVCNFNSIDDIQVLLLIWDGSDTEEAYVRCVRGPQ